MGKVQCWFQVIFLYLGVLTSAAMVTSTLMSKLLKVTCSSAVLLHCDSLHTLLNESVCLVDIGLAWPQSCQLSNALSFVLHNSHFGDSQSSDYTSSHVNNYCQYPEFSSPSRFHKCNWCCLELVFSVYSVLSLSMYLGWLCQISTWDILSSWI